MDDSEKYILFFDILKYIFFTLKEKQGPEVFASVTVMVLLKLSSI